jgi:hypothetical protein
MLHIENISSEDQEFYRRFMALYNEAPKPSVCGADFVAQLTSRKQALVGVTSANPT